MTSLGKRSDHERLAELIRTGGIAWHENTTASGGGVTERQIGVNAAAIRNLADRLDGMGYAGGDSYAEAEHIAVNLLADGYRPIEKPPPLQGSTSTEAARRAAIEAAAEAVRVARERRTGAGR